ncbi:hypothetical protein [Aureispira anguillae]|uniref:Uncharacterized protein n=1 Tax=Aureispira anguillae TaxID=2864201 RepID=A0A915YF82_9BACT|nr:hypothetical protein [Aureispira anguillae]BDS12028.1 hypothetical protein AsAng_0027430 [Aureispira anguillae]
MDYNQIKILLNKYWEGETSLEEEQLLKAYFNGDSVANDLVPFQPLFAYLEKEKKRTSTQPFIPPTSTNRVHSLWGNWLAIAASIVLVVAISWLTYHNSKITNPSLAKDESDLAKDTYRDPQIAYKEAKAALMLISKGLNKGLEKTKEGVKKAKK